MRKAPELYFMTLLFAVILIRWYLTMLEARTVGRNSYPEDPEFVRERERELKKRELNVPKFVV